MNCTLLWVTSEIYIHVYKKKKGQILICFGGGYLMVLMSLKGLPQAWHSPSLLLKPVIFLVILVFSPTVSRKKQSRHLDPTGFTEGTQLCCFKVPIYPRL